MTGDTFERIVNEEFPRAIPEKFRERIKNVALLVEWEPSEETLRKEGLAGYETLLGLYHGIPATMRGGEYGVGMTLPDTITLFQGPIENEAMHVVRDKNVSVEDAIRKVVRETIWHEVAHYFGMGEREVRRREHGGES